MRPAIFILFILTVRGMNSQNNLRLYTGSGELFTVRAGDSVINKKPDVDVLIENISDDSLTVKIEFENKLSKQTTLYLLEKKKVVKNKEFKYLVSIHNNKIKISFAGTEDILPLPSPLVPIKPVVDTSYKLRNNILGHYCELKEGKSLYFNNIPKTGDCHTPMPHVYLKYINMLMSRAQTEDDKFSIAENTCKNNCLSVSQLNKILPYIPYEIEKLKLIRMAYFNITDKGHRIKLDSTLKLESSKKELQSFFANANDYKLKSGISCTVSATETEINKFNEKLSVYSNDAERFEAFKKMYVDLCYNTAQVKVILTPFIHDREKLEAAKLLYYHCIDKDNFMSLVDVFSYNTTVADLNDFVSKQ